ncbi:unnamed protein product [Closterium sp. NIES-65]|nr:unnamed protein product [Closterium sp. NIES-65]
MTRPPHVHWAVGGAQASARLLPPCPFSGGAPLANGTRCCPSSLPAWSAPARASRCRAPLTASSAAPAATAPPGLSSLGAHMSLERAAHPPTDSCVPAAAPAATRRRHSNLPALPIGHAPWNPLHVRLHAAALFLARGSAPPFPRPAAFVSASRAPSHLGLSAPAEARPWRAALPHCWPRGRAIPPPGSRQCSRPPVRRSLHHWPRAVRCALRAVVAAGISFSFPGKFPEALPTAAVVTAPSSPLLGAEPPFLAAPVAASS